MLGILLTLVAIWIICIVIGAVIHLIGWLIGVAIVLTIAVVLARGVFGGGRA